MSEGTRYEIFVLEEDVPKEDRESGKAGRPRKFDEAMVTYTLSLPKKWLLAIDKGARIGVVRPVVMRAIIRQALESNPEIVTGWGRQRLSND